jgi:hypothetical protein
MILAITALVVLSVGLGAIAQQLLDSYARHRRALRAWDTRRKNLALAIAANPKPAPVKRPTARRPKAVTDGTQAPITPEIDREDPPKFREVVLHPGWGGTLLEKED